VLAAKRIRAHSAEPSACGQAGPELPDEITFQNDAVDPSVEFRKLDRHGARERRPAG
jgi:hypothetical protein